MRVAVVGPVHPYRGGVSQFTTHLARELERQHDVLVLSWRRQYPDWLYPGGDQLAAPLPADDVGGPRFLLDYRNPMTLGRGARIIRAWKPDVVVITWITTFAAPFYLILLWLLRRSLAPGVQIIAVCHNVLPHERRPFDRALTAATLRRGDAAIVPASDMRTDLAEVAPRTPGVVIPMPEFGPVELRSQVHADELRRREGLGDRVLLFFGYVRAYKGLRQLLEAMKIVLAEVTVDLLVVGQFWEPRAEYEALIEQLGIGDRVRVVDRYVADDEVADWFAAADVVVMPYVAATQSAVAALAFQQRRPVISTAVGGIPEAIEDGVTGLIVPPRDPRALAAAIVRFYRDDLGPRFTAAIEARPGGAWDRYVAGLLALATVGTTRTGTRSGIPPPSNGGRGDAEVG
jgi:glycosyltransferase involved in cell wall biosynthesis